MIQRLYLIHSSLGHIYAIYLGIVLSLVLMSTHIQAQEVTTQRVLWEKRPIPFSLTVNKERIVHFPMEVRYWIPNSIESAVSILAVNGVLYVTALHDFEKTRIRVQSLTSQKVYLLDVSASLSDEYSDEMIIMDSDFIDSKSPTTETQKWKGDWFVRLTRFAAQSLYAQERLLPSDDSIISIKIDSSTPVPLIRGGGVETIPIKSWRGGGYYVTAIRLKNISDNSIVLTHNQVMLDTLNQRAIDLSLDIRGDWIAVTPQHTTLSLEGQESITAMYLLSERTFSESL